MTGCFRRDATKGPPLVGLCFWWLTAGAAFGAEIGPAGLDTLPDADVVILGEIHDNRRHHENQARAVAAIGAKALVFEMFGPEAALRVTPEIREDPAKLARALGWEAMGWPDFDLYHPIFAAAPDAPVFGGAVARAEARRAVSDGAAAVMGSGAALFGLDDPLADDVLAERVALQGAAHCDALPEDVLPGMVEAQRLRDAALARAVVAAIAETGGPVAVITGNGHARKDWGVPRMLASVLPDTTVLTVGQFEEPAAEDAPYDLWLVTEAEAREDPCASFR